MGSTIELSQCADAVVVGDDGSPSAAVAIRWACDEARRRAVALVIVRAWSLTTAPRPASFEPGYVPSEDEFAEAVRASALTSVAQALGDDHGVELVPVAVHESAQVALVSASAVAAVVVVGARGRGVAKALLGSTSDYVIRHALGPVTVIPFVRPGTGTISVGM